MGDTTLFGMVVRYETYGLESYLAIDVDWDMPIDREARRFTALIPHSVKARWPDLSSEARAAVLLTAQFADLVTRRT